MVERAQIVLSATDQTRAAFLSAQRNLDGLKTRAAGVSASLGPLLGTVGLLGSALSLVSFKSVVSGIDAFNDLHDATGASVENLSALENVAKRTGTGFEAVGAALLKFQKGLIDAKPGTDMAANLEAIGLSVEDLKRADPAEAFRQVAIALNQYDDNGKRALQTQALFGKQTRETAAFLKNLAESGELVATVTAKQAQEAEDFNRQFLALEKNIVDAARGLTVSLLPSLNDFAKYASSAGDGVSLLDTATAGLRTTFQAVVIFGANVSFVLKGIGREAGAVAAQLVALKRLDFAGFSAISDAVKEDGVKARAELDAFETKMLGLGKPSPDEKDGKPRRPDAPDVADSAGKKAADAAAAKAAAEALSNLRKITDGHVKAIGAALAGEQDEIRFGEQMSAQLYSRGLETLDKFYADQDKARQDNLAALRKATADEIAERQKLLNSPLLAGDDKKDDRQAIQNEIADARTKLAAAERESNQAAQLAVGARADAVKLLRDQVADLDAQISDIATGSSGAAADLLDIAHRVAAAQRVFFQAGAGENDAAKKAADYGRLLEVQRQFNEVRRNFSTITNDAARAEESLLIAASTNGDNLIETEGKLAAARAKSLSALEQLIAKTRELVALSPKNTDLQEYLADLELQAQRVRAALDPTKLRLDRTAENIGDTIADGLARATFEGGKLKDMLRDIGKSVLYQINNELLTKPLATGIGNILKGSGSGQNMIAQLFGLGSPAATNASADAATKATKNIADLATAGGGSADVLGRLPQLAAIPATTALGALAGAAQIAAAALTLVGAGAAAGKGEDALGMLGGLFGGGFGSGAAFGNQDLGQFFDVGGYTGNAGVGDVAGVVHGKEFVFSAPAVSRIGVNALEQLHNAARHGQSVRNAMLPGYAAGGYVGTPARASQRAELRPLSIVNNFVLQQPASRKTQDQVASATLSGAQRALRRNG